MNPLPLVASLAFALQAPTETWVRLRLPGLCTAAPALRDPPPLELGMHLMLPGEELASVEPEATQLHVATLLGWLEDDAARRKLAVRFGSSAPPLLVRGSPEALASVRSILAELDAIDAARAIELRAWFLEGAADVVGSRVDRATLERLVGARAPWATRSVRSGASAMLGVRARQSYLASYAVEVATDSGVADPEFGTIVTGRTLHVRAFKSSGGGVHVEGLLDLAELGALDTFATGTPDLGSLQVPRVDVLQVAFAGSVAQGDALAVVIRGAPLASRDLTLLVQARVAPAQVVPARAATTPADDGAAGSTLRGIDLAWLASSAYELPLPLPGHACELGRALEPTVLREGLSAASVAQIADDLGRSGSRAARSPALWTPAWFIAPADESATWSELTGLVAAGENPALEPFEFVLAHGDLRVVAPAAPGSTLRVLAGRERTLLVDYGVQVAQQSWMPSPNVEHVFDGLLFQGALAGDALVCDAWIAGSTNERDLERKESGIGRVRQLERLCASTHAELPRAAAARTLIEAGAAGAALSLELRVP